MLLSHDVMAAILMYQNNERWPCWGPLHVCLWDLSLFFCKKFLSFLRKLLILYLFATTNLSCRLDKSQVQCKPMHGTLHYTAFSFWLMCLVLFPEHSCRTKLEINPMVTNINFLLTISIDCQEIRLWELIKWSSKRKCFDLLSNSQHIL